MRRKEPEHSKLNTDYLSLDPIWKEAKIDELGFWHNDQFEYNSLDATLRWMHDVRIKAARENFVDVVIDSAYDEGDENSLPSSSIVARGWRKETEKEWRRRLNGEAGRSKRFADVYARAIIAEPRHRENEKKYKDRLKENMDLTTCKDCGKLSSDNEISNFY